MNICVKSACRTDTYNVVYPEKTKKLIGIDTHGGHSHSTRHDRYTLAFIGSRIPLDASDVVYELCIFKIFFRNQF